MTITIGAAAQDTPPPPQPPQMMTPPAPPTPPTPPDPPTSWEPSSGQAPMHHHFGPGMMPPGVPPMMKMHDHVQVTVESTSKPVVLERRVKLDEMDGRTLFLIPRHETTETWEQVCVSPCSLHVDRGSTYRISKEDAVTQSGTFLLPSTGEQVKIEVKPGNYWWHNVGTKLIGTGTVAGIVGAALISTAHTWDKHKSEVHVRTAGIITASVGAAALAIGIPLAILTQTKVTENGIKIGKAEPNKPPPPRLTLDGLVF